MPLNTSLVNRSRRAPPLTTCCPASALYHVPFAFRYRRLKMSRTVPLLEIPSV